MLRVAALEVGNSRIFEPLQLLAHATDRGHDRAPPRLGGMRGENGMDLEIRDQFGESFASELRPQLADRRGQRLTLRRRPAVPLAKHPRAVVLLGEVRQVEVARKRARDQLGPLELPRSRELFRGTFITPVVACADDERAQLLDVAEKTRSAVVRNHVAQESTEKADVTPQRLGDLLAGGFPSLIQPVWRRCTPGSRPARAGTPR